MKTVGDVGATKLQAREQERIREAVDALFFCEDPATDTQARSALADSRALARELVDSDRWSQEAAERLLHDVESCGPLSLVA